MKNTYKMKKDVEKKREEIKKLEVMEEKLLKKLEHTMERQARIHKKFENFPINLDIVKKGNLDKE